MKKNSFLFLFLFLFFGLQTAKSSYGNTVDSIRLGENKKWEFCVKKEYGVIIQWDTTGNKLPILNQKPVTKKGFECTIFEVKPFSKGEYIIIFKKIIFYSVTKEVGVSVIEKKLFVY